MAVKPTPTHPVSRYLSIFSPSCLPKSSPTAKSGGGNEDPIESRQGVWGGIPVFHRTRVPVFFYLDALDQDMTITEFLEEFDVVTEEHIDGFWELS